ncbi:ferrous iron transport protein A [Vicingaceae bacterium]|nr:ferrous iron transport protein A [Vicingaceae bacterium]
MSQKIPLSEAKKGDLVTIESIHNESLSVQLLCMGCMVGEEILIEQIAPLGDPMMISIDGALLSLRIDDAKEINVLTQKEKRG